MAKKSRLKQAPGRTVPQEDGAPWPAEGMPVEERTRYIRRRLADGDLVECGPTPKQPAPEPETAAADKPVETPDKNETGRKGRKSGDE